MTFRVNNKQLLKNYSKIWGKNERLLNIDLESKPVYSDDDEYIKTKIKISANDVTSNFHNKKYLKKKNHASVYQ